MKSIKLSLEFFLFILVCSVNTFAQEETNDEEFSPAIIVVSTFHWNPDPNKDFSDWKKTEQEYYDKVTNKNDLILGAGVYTHLITPDDSELLFVTVFNSWEAVEKSKEITLDLIEEGWEDEGERASFFKKQNSYYTGEHTNEIVTSLPYHKNLETDSKEPLIYYIRRNKIGKGGKGYQEFFDNVIMKNNYIKGYSTHRQLYGATNRAAVEIAVFESFADFDKSTDENIKLAKEHWPDEEERKAFFKEFRKIFSSHGDFIYQNVPELAK